MIRAQNVPKPQVSGTVRTVGILVGAGKDNRGQVLSPHDEQADQGGAYTVGSLYQCTQCGRAYTKYNPASYCAHQVCMGGQR